ncbi:MAG: hypothetical protein AAGG69_12910 [Pseudomonadota bacterium]
MKLRKNDSEDLGFALACMSTSVISWPEFQEWAVHAIEQVEDAPSYLFDILDTNKREDFKWRESIGFYPASGLNSREEIALDGIGYKRNNGWSTDAVSRVAALAALKSNPQVMERFCDAFPFLSIPKPD